MPDILQPIIWLSGSEARKAGIRRDGCFGEYPCDRGTARDLWECESPPIDVNRKVVLIRYPRSSH